MKKKIGDLPTRKFFELCSKQESCSKCKLYNREKFRQMILDDVRCYCGADLDQEVEVEEDDTN